MTVERRAYKHYSSCLRAGIGVVDLDVDAADWPLLCKAILSLMYSEDEFYGWQNASRQVWFNCYIDGCIRRTKQKGIAEIWVELERVNGRRMFKILHVDTIPF